MAMIGPIIQKQLEAEIKSAFAKEFAEEAAADPTAHDKMAKIMSVVAVVIIEKIQSDGEVAPGIPTTQGATLAPGKIL